MRGSCADFAIHSQRPSRRARRRTTQNSLALATEEVPPLDFGAAAIRMVKHDSFGQMSGAEQAVSPLQPGLKTGISARHLPKNRCAHVEREAQMLFQPQRIALDVRAQRFAWMLAI